MRLTSVVLPDPDGPTSARTSPGWDLQRHVAHDPVPGSVRERDVVELDRPRDPLDVDGVGTVLDRRLGVEDLEHAGDRAGALAELAVQAGDRREARADRDPVEQEPGQRPDREGAVDHLVARVPEQDGDGGEPEEAHDRAERRPPQREPRAPGDHARRGPPS